MLGIFQSILVVLASLVVKKTDATSIMNKIYKVDLIFIQ